MGHKKGEMAASDSYGKSSLWLSLIIIFPGICANVFPLRKVFSFGVKIYKRFFRLN
ncbi:MAG: hypothetical protein ACI30W_07285 [Muribaculaceae bacterium]